MINNIKDQLLRDEGERLKPYTDTMGKLTIGVGHNLTENGISQDISRRLLNEDVYAVDKELKKITWINSLSQFDDVRYNVLLNMGFNLGVHTLLTFKTFLAFIAQHNWAEAAIDGRGTAWYKEVGARAERLMTQLETGEWQ